MKRVLTMLAALLLVSSTALALDEVTNSIGMRLVLVPAGEFMMGCADSGEALAALYPYYDWVADFYSDELPRHRVRITRPFYFGKYEVTFGQFKQFVADTGHRTQAEQTEDHPRGSGGWGFNQATQKFEGRDPKYNWRNPGYEMTDDMPVVNVTWNDATGFCRWLSEKEGKTYRLPTEAEWEYACRAATTTRYWSGDAPETLAQAANVADLAFSTKFPEYYPQLCLRADDRHALPAAVGSYPPNPFGLHDMHGNVWEWISDWYAKDYYERSPTDNPAGPDSGRRRVRRGGAWHTSPPWARASFRNYNRPESRYPNLGFRVVCETE